MNFLHLWSSYFVLLYHRNLYTEWTIELKAMADRIISMRQQLFDALRARGQHLFIVYCSLMLLNSFLVLQ